MGSKDLGVVRTILVLACVLATAGLGCQTQPTKPAQPPNAEVRLRSDHWQVSENVFNNLPTWQRELWSQVRGPFIEKYSFYPDSLAPVNDPAAVAKEEPRYKEFMYIDGLFAQQMLSLSYRPAWPYGRWYGERTFDRLIEWPQFEKVFGHYFDMMVRAGRAGDQDSAAKAAGIVSHLLCDHHPGDHIDGQIWQGLLIPPPDGAKGIPDCWPITGQQVNIPRVLYSPRLLGTTREEVLFRFYQRYLDINKRAVKQIHRMLLAAYAGKPDEAQAILSRSRLLGIEITSDYIYTAISMAQERYDPAELAAAKTLDLTTVFPTINEMDFTYTFGPYNDAVIEFFNDGRLAPQKQPPALLVRRAGQAKAALADVRPVLSVLADSGCQYPDRRARLVYDLPKGVYRRFHCLGGMAPGVSAKSDKGRIGRVAVKVVGDGKVLFEKASVLGGDEAFEIDVPIEGVRTLELWVTNLYKTTDEFWLGQFVWGRPTLTK